MAILASRNAPGGAIGDTINGDVVVHVFADMHYGFAPAAVATDLHDTVATKADRPDVATKSDGYRVKTSSNGLVYVVNDGVYEVENYEVSEANVAARDALTEVETGQRVYIDDIDRTDRYNGTDWVEGDIKALGYNTYADLPDPTTVRSGTEAIVLNDPTESLRGKHIALGADAGQMAAYWSTAA